MRTLKSIIGVIGREGIKKWDNRRAELRATPEILHKSISVWQCHV
jgi:hypothetical protein